MESLPPLTNKQKQILLLLYKFRFLTTKHVQKLINYQTPQRIQIWLKDMIDKEYLLRIYSRKTFEDNTKPAIYYLATKARHILKENPDCSTSELTKVYKEKLRSQKFIKHCLSLADFYLFFVENKSSEETLHFFTKTSLSEYKHFPDPLPDAYLSVKKCDSTKRYFIDLFDEFTPPFVIRKRVKMYIQYIENGIWEEITKSDPPSILLVLPSETSKRHINWYGKSLLSKVYNDKIHIYLTVKANLISNNKNIWQKTVND